MYRPMKSLTVSAAVLAALFALAVPAMADYISDVQANDTTGNLVELNAVPNNIFGQGNNNQYPVVTALLSTPGTVHGRTYSNYAMYVNDGTGGMDVFSPSSTLSSLGYTPQLGDALDIKATYTPFDGFPEVATLTQAALQSTGNSTYPPVTGYNIQGILNDYAANAQTVTSGTVHTTILPNDVAAQLVTLDNVWLSSFGTATLQTSFGTLNQQYTLNDSSGGTCSLFYWPTSYSVPLQNLYGQPIAYGSGNQYDMTGFLDYFSGTGIEFVPMTMTQVTSVPEPGTMALVGAGTTVAAVTYFRRKRKKFNPRTA